MKIIMLSGKGSSGKSTTLNLVYDTIIPKSKIIEPKSVLGDPKQKDFECIIHYSDKKIAFFTMGDYVGKLNDAFVKYANLQCDILICTCRNSFKDPFQRIRNYPHVIVEKTMPLSKESNEKDKETILKEIEK